MSAILQSFIDQWPSMTFLCVLGISFWALFRRHLSETRALIDQSNTVFSDALSRNKEIVSQYKELCEQNRIDIDKYRMMADAAIKDNEEWREKYNLIRSELHELLLENQRLKTIVDKTNEMVRATGGDVKVIAKELEKTRSDIDKVSEQIELLPSFNSSD